MPLCSEGALADVDEDDAADGFEDAVVVLGIPGVFLDLVALADGDDAGVGQRCAALAVDDDGRQVGEVSGIGASQQTERWLRRVGYTPD